MEGAERQVRDFHAAVAAGKFAEIEIDGDPATMLVPHFQKLGIPEDTRRVGSKIQFTPSGKTLNLTYRTRFSLGEADELFVFETEEASGVRLIGYQVVSDKL